MRTGVKHLLCGDDGLAATLAVPHRDAVSPPELPCYRPVVDVLQPVEVDAAEVLRDELQAAVVPPPTALPPLGGGVLGRGDGRPCQLLHTHEPLRRDQRLDDRVAALAMADCVDVRLGAYEAAVLLKTRDDGEAGSGD